MKTVYSKEPVDFKLLILVSLKRLRFAFYGICAGAIIFAGSYYLARNVFDRTIVYEAVAEVYLEYLDEAEVGDYYINKQTWEAMVYNDIITQYAIEELGTEYQMDYIQANLTATLLSDARIVTVTMHSENPAEAIEVVNGYARAIQRFAPEMKEINSARIFTTASKAEEMGYDDRTWAMALAGAVIGGVLSILGIGFYFAIDDSIYVPAVIETRYGIPALGITTDSMRKLDYKLGESYMGDLSERTTRKTEFYRQWLQVNYMTVTKGMKKVAVIGTSLGDNTDFVINLLNSQIKNLRESETRQIDEGVLSKDEAFYTSADYEIAYIGSVNKNALVAAEALKYDGVILLIKAGDHNGKLVERALDILRTQKANVCGAILYDTNAALIKNYVFPPLCSSTKKLKEDIYNAINSSDIGSEK